jgi:transcriptional regulator with GAF, ATPase, and Fis domain
MTSLVGSPLKEQDYVLSLASVFEGEFSIDWLVSLSDAKVSMILDALNEGQHRGWIQSKGTQVHVFSDPKQKQLLRDQIEPHEMEQLHRQIIEMLITELSEENHKLQVICPYLLKVNNDVDGCRWLVRAGNQYRHVFRIEEALQCYSKALEDLSGLLGQEADSLFTHAAIQYSKISTAKHDTRRVLSILKAAMDRCKKLNDSGSQALLEMHMAKNEWLRSRYRNALKFFESGWSLAKELDDPRVLRSATTFSTFFLYWQGRFQEAVTSYEKAVPDVEKITRVRFNLFAALTVGVCYAQIGQITQGLGMMNAIRNQAEEIGDHYLSAQAECAIGAALLDNMRCDDALPYLEGAVLKRAHLHHNQWMIIMGKLMLAYAYFLEMDKKRTTKYLKEFLQESRRVHVTVHPYPYLMTLCWAMEENNLPHIPELSLDKETQRILKGQNVFMKGVAYRYRALLQRKRGLPVSKAMKSLNSSLRWLELSGSQIEISRTRLELAHQNMIIGNECAAQTQTVATAQILSSLKENLIPNDLKYLVQGPLEGEKLLNEILKLSQELVTFRENKDVVQHIFSAVNRITGAERGAIFFLEQGGDTSRLKLRASKNLVAEQLEAPGFGSAKQMIEEVARSGRGRVLDAATVSDSASLLNEIIHSCICVPMILRDQVVGVLYHDNRLLKNVFKESDLKLLAYFAAQAAIAMDNARAYEEINRLNCKLTEEKLYYEKENLQHLHFEDFIGESPAIMRVLSQVEKVACTETSVLILGETGVGKELVARAIHRHSLRRDKPFIRVLCNTLPDSLISSEFFGHEKGAFTGATRRRIGRFELADGGTIFLDEIGELPREVQVRLLRVLQTKEFERVGGSKTLRSDFRLVAATNRNLEKEVKAKRLRMDLYYRMNVFPIYVPPLRERRADIPLLAHFFLQSYATKMGKSFGRIAEDQMDKLTRYDWPGNVRELENVIERATILNPGPRFRVPEQFGGFPHISGPQTNPTLREAERRHILWAMQKTGWKVRGKAGCSELLDVHPSTLAYRMKKLGIQKPAKASSNRRSDKAEIFE